MWNILIIGLGGFIGAVLRYGIGGLFQMGVSTFPIGTFAVNVTGSFLLGILMYLSEFRGFFNEETRLFLAVGVLGAFTTMSTFGYESLKLMEQKETYLFGLNVAGTVVMVLIGVYLGRAAAITIWRI